MHIINFISNARFSKTVLFSSMLMISDFVMAHEGHDMQNADASKSSSVEMMDMSKMDHSQMNHSQMNHAGMNHSQMSHANMHHPSSAQVQQSPIQQDKVDVVDHSQHMQVKEVDHSSHVNSISIKDDQNHHEHDHRREHGAQVYVITTMDHKWLVNDDGEGALKSELETRIGTDENKLFIKIHADKQESHDAEFDAKVLYSRMISDFWDAQAGVRYRSEKVRRDHLPKDTEEKLDAVIGLHGMVPYFFETDAYFYAGEDRYTAFSLETERDLLLTQKLIFKPYLDLNVIFSDDSKYAKKTGLSNVTAGLETRYEITKNVMPYIDIAYEYSKAKDETPWQVQSDSEKGWLYGAGVRFKF